MHRVVAPVNGPCLGSSLIHWQDLLLGCRIQDIRAVTEGEVARLFLPPPDVVMLDVQLTVNGIIVESCTQQPFPSCTVDLEHESQKLGGVHNVFIDLLFCVEPHCYELLANVN